MNKRRFGPWAVITGASSGIGKVIPRTGPPGLQRLVLVSILGVPEVDAAVSRRWKFARSGFTH